MAVVVVESPAKAKTINAYLGKDYKVLASYGHVRDLPPKDGSVDTENAFEMRWEVAPQSQKHVRAIAEALKDDSRLILATDPDREGEAISWHLLEALKKRRALKKDTDVRRVVFNAITKSAVTEAMEHPREVDMELVEAYLARRALDYLVGFTLSPVLWRKLPGAKSAGRVQSVALRAIVERELEIEAFRPREYWSVRAEMTTPRGDAFEARLVGLDGARLDRFDLGDEAAARAAVAAVETGDFAAASVEAKPTTRNPAPPFTTSTLQQEASRKLGLGPRESMRTAQRLYEAGHITYMRTDGVDMAPEAVHAARDAIGDRYGADYVPERPRLYKTKAKNAQEAHECIRPTRMAASPDAIRIDREERRLYELIWKRALASQMASARIERTTVEIADKARRAALRATGQVVTFDGFLRVYEEGRDEAADEDDRRLPEVREGEALRRGAVTPEQHFTQPPPRYTEAALVRRLEELGIGRPSTYASIISTVQDRGYVRREKNRLMPEDKGRLVTAFLMNYFSRYVEYDFTAALEEELDDVSGGRVDWKAVLERFWRDFSAAVEETADLRIGEVLETINEFLSPHLFPDPGDGSDPRVCPNCGQGRLALRTSRAGGAFIGCSAYPECRYTRPLGGEVEGGDTAGPGGRLLGHDGNGVPVTLRTGRFGPYVQLGEAGEGEKPPRTSVPKGVELDQVDLEMALRLLELPREVGRHPDDGEPIEAGIGRFGPFVRHNRTFASLEKGDDVLTVGMNRAMELIARKASRGRGGAKPLKALGEHPEGGEIAVMDGRYGPYVKWGKINATLPKGTDADDVNVDMALELIAEKAKTKGKGRAKKTTTKKAATKKAATKKTAAATPALEKARGGGRSRARRAADGTGGESTAAGLVDEDDRG
ncbi:MAG TPA: type I DNA topoisomerase [Thermohalobaculum sp.]|nr:type I DNA topoisomerase [Thermohalobaculum sp.]